ncbi:hypothetical protein [Halomicrococcus gelatinilyticus]|uniref:hypothetical protein n=1 Tax=Halomicrococcus gelatinilyticus TaxID=1702103 RepID=UPI002E15EA38
MAFGLEQIQNINSSLNSLRSAFGQAGSAASAASASLQSANQDIGAISNHVTIATTSLKYLRSAWGVLVAGATRESKSLRADIEELNAAYRNLQSSMGAAVAPAFEVVAETLTGVLQLLNEHRSVAKALGVAMGVVLSVLSVLVAEYAALTTQLVFTETLLASTRTGAYLTAAAEKAWATATSAVTKAKTVLAGVLSKENLLKAAGAVKSAALAAAEYALAGAEWAVAAGATAASVGVGLLGAALSALGIGPLLVLLGALVGGLALLADHLGLIDFDPIVAGFQSFVETLAGLLPSVDQVVSFLKTLVGVGGEPTGMAKWAKLLLSVLFPVLPVVQGIIAGVQALSSVLSDLDVSGVLAGLVPSNLLGSIGDVASKAGATLLRTLAAGIVGVGAGPVVSALKAALGPLGALLPASDADEGPLSNLTGAGASLVRTIASGVLAAPTAIAGAVANVLGNALGSLGGAALSLGAEIASGIASGIQNAAGAIDNAVSGVVGGAVDAAGGAADAVGSAVSGATNAAAGAANAVSNAAGAAGSVASDVGGAAAGATRAVGDVAGGIANAAGGLLGGGGSGGAKTQNNNTQIHFHGEVHDAQKVDRKVRKAQRQAVRQAHGGIEDALDMGRDARESLL